MISIRTQSVLSLSFGFLSFTALNAQKEKPNVLFISIDDLNDWVGCLDGHPQALTPNIDKLATKGLLFTNAHCQAPISGTSRASIMTGLYPFQSGNYLQLEDKHIKKSNSLNHKAIFMPDYFEQHGYKTMAVGKIYHNGDGAHTFDEYGGRFSWMGPKPEERINFDPAWMGHPNGTQTDWGVYPGADSLMTDFKSAAWAVNKLKQNHEKPFFLAVGFVRPHVPWYTSKKWFDLFPLDEVQLPPYNPSDFNDIPAMAEKVAAVPMMPTTEWLKSRNEWKEPVQAYLACIAFVDHQVGKVHNALENSPYANNTIIVLWSDHGYHLGEKNRFAKQALWREDTRTVFMIHAPGKPGGEKNHSPLELIDMYPTLTELCGLPAYELGQGKSLVPLMDTPGLQWETPAVSVYGKGNIALTGTRYRLIQYEDGSQEFYDLENDPNEWNNLAQSKRFFEEKAYLETFIPSAWSASSPHSAYNINEYFRNKPNN